MILFEALGNDWKAVTPVVGDPPGPEEMPITFWGGLQVYDGNRIWADEELRWLNIDRAPWLYSEPLDTWIYVTEDEMEQPFSWCFVVDGGR